MSKKKDIESLDKIDLTKFMKKGKGYKREPICKGCKSKDCDSCCYYEWKDLGYNLERIADYFINRLSCSIAGALYEEFSASYGTKEDIEKMANKLILRTIDELKMQIKLDEGG